VLVRLIVLSVTGDRADGQAQQKPMVDPNKSRRSIPAKADGRSQQEPTARAETVDPIIKVSNAKIMERNPEEAAAFLSNDDSYGPFTPVGFHPTDEDVVFVALHDAVFTYSIKHGTMSPGCTTHGCLLPIAADVYPYVHPAYPVQIPAIKDRNLRSK
jgi:hypothetical protein